MFNRVEVNDCNGKTPESDGLPKEFYLAFWELLKEDFAKMANNCVTDGVMPESLRQALICSFSRKITRNC